MTPDPKDQMPALPTAMRIENGGYKCDPIRYYTDAQMEDYARTYAADLRARVVELEEKLAAERQRVVDVGVIAMKAEPYQRRIAELEAALAARQPVEAEKAAVRDAYDPHPDKTDSELGVAYRMMLEAHRNGLKVDFPSGWISLPDDHKAAPAPAAVKGEVTDERAEFEAWCVTQGWVSAPTARPNGTYVNGMLQARWLGWQGRALLSQQGTKP